MPSPTAPRTPRALLLVLGALTAFGPLSIDMYLPGLPTLQRELGTSASAVQLTLAAFIAGLGVGQLVYGPLSDRLGRRRPLVAGVALYVLASAACAFAPSIGWLIALRFLQAVGGAAGTVIARAVVRDLYSGREAARVLSLLVLVMGVAPILAPLTGGWVLAVAGWRAIFGVLAVLGALCLVLAPMALPRTGPQGAHGAPGTGGLGASVRAVLADRRFVAASLAGGCASAGLFAYISGAPFVLMELHHVSPQGFARLFGLNALGFIGATQLNRRLLVSFAPGRIAAAAALVASAAGSVLVGLAVTGAGGVPAVSSSLFVFLASVGLVLPNATALAMEAHGARAGVASALLGAIQYATAAGVSSLVGLFNDGSMLPMAGAMGVCAAAAWVATALTPAGPEEAPEGATAMR